MPLCFEMAEVPGRCLLGSNPCPANMFSGQEGKGNPVHKHSTVDLQDPGPGPPIMFYIVPSFILVKSKMSALQEACIDTGTWTGGFTQLCSCRTA